MVLSLSIKIIVICTSLVESLVQLIGQLIDKLDAIDEKDALALCADACITQVTAKNGFQSVSFSLMANTLSSLIASHRIRSLISTHYGVQLLIWLISAHLKRMLHPSPG